MYRITVPMLTLLCVVTISAAATAQLQSAPVRTTGIANVLDFPGVDPTGTDDSVAAINSALATRKDVYLPAGAYTIGSDWIKMTTPNQRFFCDGPSTTITVVKAPVGVHGATPALVIYPNAKGARFEGCTVDHNGAQFTGNFPKVPLRALNRRQGSDAFNAALGTTVLVMADHAQINGVHVKRGWNVCIGFGVFDFDTGRPTYGPFGASYSNGTTSLCGQGRLTGNPNYQEGAGVDNFSGIGTRITNSVDYNSQVGLYLDTGASSTIVDTFASFNAQISPHIAGTWQSTIGGDAVWFGGQNRQFNGRPGEFHGPTIINNIYAYNPMRHCLLGSDAGTGAIVSNVHCVRPGLEGARLEGGMHKLSNIWIDQANHLRGSTAVPPGTPAEQTNALQINANSHRELSDLYWKTDIMIDGLTITGDKSPKWAYSIGLASHGKNYPAVKINPGNELAPGAVGLYGGNATYNLNLNGIARPWTPEVVGTARAGTPAYADRSGQYWQTNGTTYLTFNVSTTSLEGVEGDLILGNLPIKAGGSTPDHGQCWFSAFSGIKFSTGYSSLGGLISPKASLITIYESGSNVATQRISAAHANTSGVRLAGGCIYHQ